MKAVPFLMASAAAILCHAVAMAQVIQPASAPASMATPARPLRVPEAVPPVQAVNPGQPAADAAKPPPSRLGQQVGTPVPVVMPVPEAGADGPAVVYPPADAIVERAVRQIEDMQLTPDQYQRLKGIFMERQSQRAMPYVEPAKPVTRTLLVNLDPGVSPPSLRLSRAQQTNIVFSDASGQPWFIEKVSLNRQLFSDGKGGGTAGAGAIAPGQGEAPTNVLTLEPLLPAAYGNVTVTLRGQSTPVIFILTTGQREVDMRVDAKVPGKNPDAQVEVSLQAAPGLDNALPYFLDGVPPASARRLRVAGLEGAEAWIYEKNLYVKARANAQYPAYFSAARSTSGISVYRYMGVPKAATFTVGGRAMTAFFE